MLDAFIIDRIRREKEAARTTYVPLRVEVPPPPERNDRVEPAAEDRPDRDRGVTEVDFSL